MRRLKENKVLRAIMTIIKVFITVALLAFILVVCMQRFSNNKLSLFSYRLFAVATESMVPRYNVGDVLISKDTDPSLIKVGDTVSYIGQNANFYGKVITHEVVKIDQDETGKYIFHTKGLANLVEDPLVAEEHILGVVKYRSVILSTVYKIVSTEVGFYLFIIIPVFYVITSELIATMLEKEEERRNKSK